MVVTAKTALPQIGRISLKPAIGMLYTADGRRRNNAQISGSASAMRAAFDAVVVAADDDRAPTFGGGARSVQRGRRRARWGEVKVHGRAALVVGGGAHVCGGLPCRQLTWALAQVTASRRCR